ncbi:hypothetical protein LCGC14_2923190 [marine sediment metagenome]|uniref:Uncharacterized protein n=1 Tax=marine sediment metagenome TaxID=412755 RepID=A0A0F8XNI1_9ZZZZ
MRKNISLTGYRLRKGRRTLDTAEGQKSFLLDEGRSLVEAATQDNKYKVRSENSFTFDRLLAYARERGLHLTPTYLRSS